MFFCHSFIKKKGSYQQQKHVGRLYTCEKLYFFDLWWD